MKKIIVNQDACIGCGACVAIDPDHFNFNDNGLSEAINHENLESDELKNAIESCPTSAISIDEVVEERNTCDCEECECDNCECENCECENCDCSDCNCKAEA